MRRDCYPRRVPSVDFSAVEKSWTDEITQALKERSAWAHVGTVEIARPSAKATLGGFIDRRIIPLEKGASPLEALEAWRKTSDGRIVDRVLQNANNSLLGRLAPAGATMGLD